MDDKSKKMWILLGVLAVIVIIIIVAALQGKKSSQTAGTPAGTGQTAGTEQPTGTSTPTGTTTPVQQADANKVYDLKGATAVVPGASLVTKDQKVVTPEGKAVKNDAIPNTPEAPKPVLVSKDQLPKQTISLEIGNGKITPSSFTVPTGAPVSLAVTSTDGQVHVFIFSNSAVGAIAMGISGGQTKAITFNAPAPGTYDFRCDVPGHKDKGEFGTMIVK